MVVIMVVVVFVVVIVVVVDVAEVIAESTVAKQSPNYHYKDSGCRAIVGGVFAQIHL